MVHTPTVGYSQTLRCAPPPSYPSGSVYWGYSQPRSTKLDAIETDDRVLLDYDGGCISHYLCRRRPQGKDTSKIIALAVALLYTVTWRQRFTMSELAADWREWRSALWGHQLPALTDN